MPGWKKAIPWSKTIQILDPSRPKKSNITENSSFLAIIGIDHHRRIKYLNEVALATWEILDPEKIIGQDIASLFTDQPNVQELLDRLDQQSDEISFTLPNGRPYMLNIAAQTGSDAQAAKGHTLYCSPITTSPMPIDEDGDTALAILQRADIGIIACNERGQIVQANESAQHMFGYQKDELLGLSVHQLLPPHLRNQHEFHIRDFIAAEDNQRLMKQRGEITGYRSDGSFFPIESTISKYQGPNGTMLIASMRDISDKIKAEEELIWQASHDHLTKLVNRTTIKDRLDNALERSKRTGDMIALMFIDLDEFKFINDNYGHNTGDKVLVNIANRLLDVVRPGDTVARFGGDEFVILCDQINDHSTIPQLMRRIIDNVKRPLEIEGHQFFPTVSIGIANGYGTTTNTDVLLRNADAAMYSVKSQGRDGWQVFSDEIRENSSQHLKIANGLKRAIDENQLQAYFQPIIEINTLKSIGCEALLRWSMEGKPVSPELFMPIAEMTGSIIPIGDWVFEQACENLAIWKNSIGIENIPYVSINLSARQLSKPDLVATFSSIMNNTHIDSEKIVLEITETTLMADIDISLRVLQELGELGISLAIDDFGTGHSSLSRIKSLPVDTIKVDKAFITNIAQDMGDKAITSAVIHMAHELGLKVTAEGVETIEQLHILGDMHCNNAQGYLFDRAVPAQEFLTILQNNGGTYQNIKTRLA